MLLALTLTGSAFGQLDDEQIGAFYYFQDIDDFDDTDYSYIFTLANNKGDCTPLSGGITCPGIAILHWYCLEDKLFVDLMLNQPFLYTGDQDKRILVRYRFDKDDPTPMHAWSLSSDRRAALLPVRNEPAFTVAAKASNSVLIQADDHFHGSDDPLDGQSHRFRFSLSGFTRALSLLTCAEHSPRTLE